MDTHCPHCNSGATQAVDMVVLTGTRSWTGAFGSVPLGRGSVRVGGTVGTSRSALAAQLDPGPRPSYITLAAGAFFAYAVWFFMLAPAFTGWGVSGVSLLLLAGTVFAFLRRRQARAAWLEAVDGLFGAWLCRKCGWVWRP